MRSPDLSFLMRKGLGEKRRKERGEKKKGKRER